MAEEKPTRHSHNFKDLTGQRFGRLVAIELAPKIKRERVCFWKCVCDCGTQVTVRSVSLTRGSTQSCGCYCSDHARETETTHGRSKTVEYGIWAGAKTRCNDPNVKHFSKYGGRGITMSKEWSADFMAFYRDMGQRPSPEHSLDRVDNDGPYSKENCRWATQSEQARNTRGNLYITYAGETLTLIEWSERTGINYKTLHTRHSRGLPLFTRRRKAGAPNE